MKIEDKGIATFVNTDRTSSFTRKLRCSSNELRAFIEELESRIGVKVTVKKFIVKNSN
jgi:hypothetical protein